MQVSYSENVLVIFSKGFLNPYFMMSPFYWLPPPVSDFVLNLLYVRSSLYWTE